MRMKSYILTPSTEQITREEWNAFNKKIATIINRPGPKVFIKNKLIIDPTSTRVINQYNQM